MDAEPGEALDVYFCPEVAPAGFGWLVPFRRGARPRAKVGVAADGHPQRALGRVLP